jgi:hypothetical protein
MMACAASEAATSPCGDAPRGLGKTAPDLPKIWLRKAVQMATKMSREIAVQSWTREMGVFSSLTKTCQIAIEPEIKDSYTSPALDSYVFSHKHSYQYIIR